MKKAATVSGNTPSIDAIEELQQKIKDFDTQPPEVIEELKELGVTKEQYHKALVSYQEFFKLQEVEERKEKEEVKEKPSKWHDLRDYFLLVVEDLKNHEEEIPELNELVEFFQKSIEKIEISSQNDVAKILKAQLMGQLYNLNINTFLQKVEAKKMPETEDLANQSAQGDKTEYEKEQENNRAKYIVKHLDDEDRTNLENVLQELKFDPRKIKTEAGLAIIARFAFRNNLSYLVAGSTLALRLNNKTILALKETQKKLFLSWAGNPATGESRKKNIDFYRPIILIWETRGALWKKNLNIAKGFFQELKTYKLGKNLQKDIEELAKEIKNYSPKVSLKENLSVF